MIHPPGSCACDYKRNKADGVRAAQYRIYAKPAILREWEFT
jgi:hypothetical protein